MPPIGETLREARLRQGIDIVDVEQATKIRARYLRALESEEFEHLPGPTFVRTFIRTYADHLGLDAQLLVEEYRSRHEEAPAAEELQPFTPQPSQRGGREPRGRPRPPSASRGTVIGGVAIAALAVLLLIGLLAGGEEEPDDEGAAAQPGERRGEDGPTRKGGDGAARGKGRAGGEGSSTGEPLELRVTPLAETYVCVDDDAGKRLFEGIIAGPETFRADEALLVNFGNTQVELELNGEPVDVERGSNPVGLEFSGDGQEELSEGERPCT